MDPRFSSPHTPSFYDHEGRSPIHSTASAPSLRSPNPVYMAAMRGAEPPGGNVKVVVRVRKFLARGERAPLASDVEGRLTSAQRTSEAQNVSST